jgi:L-fuconolactonase
LERNPAILIVDTQAHIWAANTPERPWMEGMEKRAHLPVPLDKDMLLKEMDMAGVTRAVLVPPSLDGDRNDLCLAAAAAHPDRFAVMGRLLIDRAYAPQRLAEMARQKHLLGLRLTFHRDNDRPLLTNGKADWLWPAAEQLGMKIMLHAPERLPIVAEIAARHPDLTLIVDHMGFARETMDEHAMEGAARLLQLAKYPNVSVKVSAAPCYSSQAYPFRNLHEPIRRIIDGFGPKRCFWGSDFSRLPKGCTYRQAVTMFTEELKFLTGEDLEWVMGKAAMRCLGWV